MWRIINTSDFRGQFNIRLVHLCIIQLFNHCGKKWPWRSRFASDTLFQILVVWVTISVWPFSVSQHHLLYSSIPQEESQHVQLGMVQHFMNHVRQRLFFCFVRPKQGSEDLINSSFWRVGAATFSTMCPSPQGKIPITPHHLFYKKALANAKSDSCVNEPLGHGQCRATGQIERTGNTNWRGKFSTVDLLIRVACFIKM
jgi:hypothetical protein